MAVIFGFRPKLVVVEADITLGNCQWCLEMLIAHLSTFNEVGAPISREIAKNFTLASPMSPPIARAKKVIQPIKQGSEK